MLEKLSGIRKEILVSRNKMLQPKQSRSSVLTLQAKRGPSNATPRLKWDRSPMKGAIHKPQRTWLGISFICFTTHTAPSHWWHRTMRVMWRQRPTRRLWMSMFRHRLRSDVLIRWESPYFQASHNQWYWKNVSLTSAIRIKHTIQINNIYCYKCKKSLKKQPNNLPTQLPLVLWPKEQQDWMLEIVRCQVAYFQTCWIEINSFFQLDQGAFWKQKGNARGEKINGWNRGDTL